MDSSLLMILLGLLYCLPFLVAAVRHHHQTIAITVLNILTGWTGLGWIASLVWACTATPGC